MTQEWDLLMWTFVGIFALAAVVALLLLWSVYKERSRERGGEPGIGPGGPFGGDVCGDGGGGGD
jgi:hypothetical protein